MDIPFTTEQFFEVIRNYNQAVFPAQVVILLLGIASIFLLHSGERVKNRFIGVFLGVLWIWTGIVYHLIFFTSINPAAYGFGALFVIQGILFLVHTFRDKLEFELKSSTAGIIGVFFILFGLLFYPVLIYFLEHAWLTTITVGLPCPSTIATFGFLILTSSQFPKHLLLIPSIWTVIGISAALNFGVYPDYMMPVSALIALIYLIRRRKPEVH